MKINTIPESVFNNSVVSRFDVNSSLVTSNVGPGVDKSISLVEDWNLVTSNVSLIPEVPRISEVTAISDVANINDVGVTIMSDVESGNGKAIEIDLIRKYKNLYVKENGKLGAALKYLTIR